MNITNISILIALAALLGYQENSFADNYQQNDNYGYQQQDSYRDQQQNQQRSNWTKQAWDKDDDDDDNDDDEKNLEDDELNNPDAPD